MQTLVILEAAPIDRLYLRHASLCNEGTDLLLIAATQEANDLKEVEENLNQDFDLTLAGDAYTVQQILEYSRLLESAGLWQRLFNGEYKRAVKAYRSIAKSPKKFTRLQMGGSLRELGLYRRRHDEFTSNTGYRELLGDHFRGVHSPWEDLHAVVEWYADVLEALPEYQPHAAPFRDLLLTARIEHLRAIKAGLRLATDHRSALHQMVEHLPRFFGALPVQHSLAISGALNEIQDCAETLIWSTDWFKSRDTEVKRLLQHLKDLLARDPAYMQYMQDAKRKDELLDRLTALRDSEILPSFPLTPADNGLLNPELLNEFVQKKPKTREDWFRKIPQFHRTNVDSKQVSRYLDRVLEIIAECE